MEALKLTTQEQICYGELFQSCDSDGSGKVSGLRASELFLTSGLSQDVLLQISELCGAKRLGHFGRSQFYIALKLIAAVQCGLPPKLESINAGMDIPLPKFTKTNDQDKIGQQNSVPVKDLIERQGQPVPVYPPQQPLATSQHQPRGQLPPPPATKKSHGRSSSGQFRGLVDRDGSAAAAAQPNLAIVQPQSHNAQQNVVQEDTVSNAKSPQQFSPTAQSPPSSPPTMIPSTNTVQSGSTIPAVAANQIQAAAGTAPAIKPVANQVPGGVASSASQGPGSHIVNQNAFQAGMQNAMTGGAQGTVIPERGHNSVVITSGHVPSMTSSTHSHSHPGNHYDSLNSTHEAGWASFEDDESHGLLGTGPKKTYHLEPPGFDSSSISSDPESVDDVWAINDEQRDYYTKQFQTMQPDLNGTITGAVAKEFFEKSKLPVQELSKIWQLSDLNRDGALSLEEFCIAMHLVVLRRNEIELPERLPFALMPYTAFANEEPFAADLPQGSTLKRVTPPASSPQAAAGQWVPEPPIQEQSSDTASDVASPVIKPVNFGFQKPDPESGIAHPIAVRVSPESHVHKQKDGHERGRAFSEPAPHVVSPSDTPVEHIKQRTESVPDSNVQNDADSLLVEPKRLIQNQSPVQPSMLQGRPRPVAAKKNAVPGISTGILLPAPASQVDGGNVGDQEPPLPPPRPGQVHGRSMSVDLKGLSTPPAVPPRASPKDSPALRKADGTQSAINSEKGDKFKKFETIQSQEQLDLISMSDESTEKSTRRSLSLDYNKVESSQGVTFDIPEEEEMGGGEKGKLQSQMMRQASRDKKDLQMAIRTHKERNSMLERLSSELNQELQEVMEQRIALEIQLEHLKPFSS
ncbi:hypothetical protein FSP39_022716 [Pinctada imbricata]|uniref:RalBP1-associated Eps domain-containing protein 1 n=1 Tax=Pinctada imbricata TaxID=66713 RepID=A0AA88YKQ0_PINIB|nr:hypothetical protein FSP39_022716 [Pinctada imbricata]